MKQKNRWRFNCYGQVEIMNKKLVHPRLFALSHSRSVPSYDLWTFSKCPSFYLSLNLSRSALCIFLCQIPRYFAVTICLLWRFLKCCSSKLGAQGFRSWDSPFWLMPRDCPFSFPNFSFVPGASWEFHGVSRRSVQSQFSSFPKNRIPWIWILRYTTLDSFFPRNGDCSLSTFFSRPRAEVTSHHQHVDFSNECHKCICFPTCNYDTRDDADNYTTVFFILSTIDKGFLTLALRLFELFTSVCSFTFGTEEDACSKWVFPASPTFFHIVSRRPVACVCRKKTAFVSSWTRPNSLPLKTFSSLPLGARIVPLSFCHGPLRWLLLGISRSSSEILFGQGIFCRCIYEERQLGIVMPWVQVPIPAAWLVIDIGHFPPFGLLSCFLFEKNKSVDCYGSSLSLFSIPSVLRIIVSFIRISSSMLTIKNVSRNTHIFPCIGQHSNFAAKLSWTWDDKSLMRNVGTVMTARWVGIMEDFWGSINFNSSRDLRTWSLKRLTVRYSWSCCVRNYSNLRCFTVFSSW